MEDVLDAWATSGVAGHFEGGYPWAPYHATMRETVANLVGALPGEAVVMNSLTVNLHLVLGSFYRPSGGRYRIVIEADVFPSDRYAVMGVAHARGLDPDDAVVVLRPRPGDHHLRTDDVTGYLAREGSAVALVVLSAVDFRTGALHDVPAITAAAHAAGATMGWDLAHAAGNVPLRLHDWQVDFAVWCHYKYLNAGPGAVGGAFVHERHGSSAELVRPGGWWGHDPHTRFDMPFAFTPVAGAEGWQVSNPPILAMAPVARVARAVRPRRNGGAAVPQCAPHRLPRAHAGRRGDEAPPGGADASPAGAPRRPAERAGRRRGGGDGGIVRRAPGPGRRPAAQRDPPRASPAVQHL